jgi:hypothetical protein
VIVEATTAKECREALYDAYEDMDSIVLDISSDVDHGRVPVTVLECGECKGKKTIVYLGTYPIPESCGRCGAELQVTHVVSMVTQEDVVLYRMGDS